MNIGLGCCVDLVFYPVLILWRLSPMVNLVMVVSGDFGTVEGGERLEKDFVSKINENFLNKYIIKL